MAIDRKKLKEQMLARAQESYASKDQGDKYGSFFKTTPGLTFWKCSENEHTIDILTWIVGSQYPCTDKYKHVKQGDFAYILDLWVHYKIGQGENNWACPLKNWGERCPICEDITKMLRSEHPDEDLIGKIKAKRRSVYYIICYDSNTEEEKGVQVWEVSHVYMEKIISSRAKLPRGGGTVLFALPGVEGKQIFFRRSGMGMSSTEYADHQFLDRNYEIADEAWTSLTPLDELIKKPSFEELYEDHYGTPYTEERILSTIPLKEQKTVSDSPQQTTSEPVKKSLRVLVESKKEEAPVAEKTAAKPKPAAKPSVSRVKVTPVKVEESVQEQTVETDVNTLVECPGGGTFGVDIDTLSACNDCPKWDDCAAEANRLEG